MSARLTALRTRFRRWALRSRAPELQPVQLGQRRVYVLPTPAGLALLATLAIMLLASINYNLSLGYALVFVLGSVFVVHILHSWRTLTGLEVAIEACGESFAGRSASWRVSLTNESRHERAGLRLRDGDGKQLLLLDVGVAARADGIFTLPAPRRGLHRPGQLSLESTQPLGWIRAWTWLEPDAPAVVYPAPEGKLPLPEGIDSDDRGHALSRLVGRDDFAGLRPHLPTDSPRHIAWKQLAQGRGLLTKIYAGSGAPSCVIDWHRLPRGMDAETRLSQLTAWVISARQAGLRTSLILPDSQTGPGDDAGHHQTCLLRLALFPGGDAA